MAGSTSPSTSRKKVFQPQCTHTTMTRLYDHESVCALCSCPGPWGWLYACTQDREDLVQQDSLANGAVCVSSTNLYHLSHLSHSREHPITFSDNALGSIRCPRQEIGQATVSTKGQYPTLSNKIELPQRHDLRTNASIFSDSVGPDFGAERKGKLAASTHERCSMLTNCV